MLVEKHMRELGEAHTAQRSLRAHGVVFLGLEALSFKAVR